MPNPNKKLLSRLGQETRRAIKLETLQTFRVSLVVALRQTVRELQSIFRLNPFCGLLCSIHFQFAADRKQLLASYLT